MPLWLVPGFTQRASSWDAVIGALDAEAGDGTAALDARAVDVPLGRPFVETARELGARHGAGSWCGYSMGGRLTLRLALDAPELVERLVLVSATAGIEDAAERARRREADGVLAASIERDGVEAFVARWLAQPMFAGVPAGAAGLADRHTFSASELAGTLRDLGQGSVEPMWDRLGELRMPVLVVHGGRDPTYAAVAARLAAAIPHARGVRLAGGHAVALEQPAQLARVLHDFHRPAATSTASTS